jgi:hypothetical protein
MGARKGEENLIIRITNKNQIRGWGCRANMV